MIGETLGHYRILEKLGEGGMGEVYRARDEKLGRDVAIKIPSAASLGNQDARAQLLNEARTAAALNHPHICTIHEVGEAGSDLFIAMEFVPGQTLKQMAGETGLPRESVIRYGMQIADALGHAHSRGVVHRDLKPANVIITPDHRAKVMDFGLATRREWAQPDDETDSQPGAAAPGSGAGTLPYMAPEILRGSGGDARSDLWSLGVALYEMATGSLPFPGRTTLDITSAILRDPPAPPSDVSTGMRAVVERCLAKEPGQRYQSAGEIRAALEAIQSELPGAKPARRSGGAIRSLAVLPFENAGGDPETEYLSDGITETIINSLAQLPGLRVMNRTTVFRYKGQRADPSQAGRELGVRGVLTGRVVHRGDTLVVTAELVDSERGWQLWGEQYNRKFADIFVVQGEIAREISEKLRLRLTSSDRRRLSKSHTHSTDAYQLYLKGRSHWSKRTPEGLKGGIEFFNQAIQADPNYALAYSGLADSYYLLASTAFAGLDPREAFPKALEAAQKALEIDDTLAEAHASLAALLAVDWKWKESGQEFRRAIKLNPGYVTARQWHGWYLIAMGRAQLALAEMKRALQIDPLSLIINRDLGLVSYYARRPDAAIRQLRKTVEMDPGFALTHQTLGRAYLMKGQHEDAVRAMEKAVALAPGSVAMSAALAHAYAVTGRKDGAQRILEDLSGRAKRGYISPVSFAIIHAGLGDAGRALDLLEQAVRTRDGGLLTIKVHPLFDGLRKRKRFQSILQRVGLAR